jgi:hypothetical protein
MQLQNISRQQNFLGLTLVTKKKPLIQLKIPLPKCSGSKQGKSTHYQKIFSTKSFIRMYITSSLQQMKK